MDTRRRIFYVAECSHDGLSRESGPNLVAYKTSERTGYVPIITAGEPRLEENPVPNGTGNGYYGIADRTNDRF